MSLRSRLWTIATNAYPAYLRIVYKMSLGKGVRIAYRAHLDKSINPRGIHIGDRTWVLNGAFVMAHDHCRHLKADTCIGNDCVIEITSLLLPFFHLFTPLILFFSLIVVTKDIPDNCIAVGNPAKVIKTGIKVYNGQIINDTNE